MSCVCWCHGDVLAVSDHRLAGEPSFYWYQVTVPTDVTVHFVCWHVYGLLAFYVLMYLLMPHTNTVQPNNNCRLTCTQTNSYLPNWYLSQLVPNANPYPSQPVPNTDSYPNQLVPKANSYPKNKGTDITHFGSKRSIGLHYTEINDYKVSYRHHCHYH